MVANACLMRNYATIPQVSNVTIFGSGLMGSGIVQSFCCYWISSYNGGY